MTNNIESEVIRAIVELITPACTNVFFGKSQVIYPKANGDLRCIEELTYGVRYRLVLDYYAADSKPSTVVTMAEDVRSALNETMCNDANGALNETMCNDANGALIVFRKTSGGGFVEEKDNEKIVHYTDAYEVNFYKNQSI